MGRHDDYDTLREVAIGWFAGLALVGLLARGTDDDTVAVEAAKLIGFDMYDELRKAFRDERMKQALQNEAGE